MVRKRRNVDIDVVNRLRQIGLSWKIIAEHPEVNVSRDVLLKWRKEVDFVEPKQSIDSDNLDKLVVDHTLCQPRRGEISIAAHVSCSGFKVSRQQLRDSIHREDPEGVEERSRKRIKRAVYHSDGPHHCWHIDGNHKLIRWGIVIHGCIDGCTRNVIYLAARDSNRSTIVLEAFEDGVARYQIPMKVRSDFGGENILVAKYMIHHRGPQIKPFIAGKSTRNTRIERLWRDMRQHTIQAYIDLFYDFEQNDMDLSNLLHIYTLQFLFLPRINADLQQFIEMWNNHKLSSESNRTPQQLLLHYNADSTASPVVIDDDGEDGPNEEGDEEPTSFESATAVLGDSVTCEPIECPLNDAQLLEFRHRIIPLSLADPFNTLAVKFIQSLHIINDIFYRVAV